MVKITEGMTRFEVYLSKSQLEAYDRTWKAQGFPNRGYHIRALLAEHTVKSGQEWPDHDYAIGAIKINRRNRKI